MNLLVALTVPVLLSIGLAIFTQSFFLSRKSFTTRSSCHGAPNLLRGIGFTDDEIRFLQKQRWLNNEEEADNGGGCWTSRRVDSLIIIVVDALRFDFARDHLPLSVGSRLFPSNDSKKMTRGYSKLYQFVADPPTVTMQRLKALTTGGLPTFADITGSFGGANVEEDSWVEQLIATRDHRSGHHINSNTSRIAFVGDDTWVDLFPTQFDDSHPYPSFNTRDLDTVDNGCLMHLPRLLDGLVGLNNNETHRSNNASDFELIVAHFLGVDHVGHTYGPNDEHMDRKLSQMDRMLSHSLDLIDAAPQQSCITAFVFGDHGMTEYGNHGGGTNEERNAGLFAHYSPGCQIEHDKKLDGGEIGFDSARSFDSINQIDLVPTISLLLGLPIPYANIGGLVPELLPTQQKDKTDESSFTPNAAVSLALNAAQIWTYFRDYSKVSRDLPVDKLNELKEMLDSATSVYKEALSEAIKHSGREDYVINDSISFRQACGLYKLFLAESTDLGKRVWTQFNETGMIVGIAMLALAWLASFPLWRRSVRTSIRQLFSAYETSTFLTNGKKGHHDSQFNGGNAFNASMRFFRLGEVVVAIVFMVFQCGILTFGNSYIDSEREVVAFFLSTLCLLVFRRWTFVMPLRDKSTYLPLIVAVCARLNDIFVTGHGLDPSIPLHGAHNSVVFLSSLLLLVFLRLRWLVRQRALIDIIAIFSLAFSWLDKRSRDHSRNGFYTARIAIALTLLGLIQSVYSLLQARTKRAQGLATTEQCHAQLALYRAVMFIIIVTGPSAASTGVLVMIQSAAMTQMVESTKMKEVDAPVMAAIWRLTIRHVFFATNHHCSFNRLHYSAAFVASNTFMFHLAGMSLFMNTFGWEIVGSIFVVLLSHRNRGGGNSGERRNMHSSKAAVWHWYLFYQWTEILASCISLISISMKFLHRSRTWKKSKKKFGRLKLKKNKSKGVEQIGDGEEDKVKDKSKVKKRKDKKQKKKKKMMKRKDN